jgi:hypothetical protein
MVLTLLNQFEVFALEFDELRGRECALQMTPAGILRPKEPPLAFLNVELSTDAFGRYATV